MWFFYKDEEEEEEEEIADAEKQEVESRARYSPPSCPCYLQYDRGAIFSLCVNGQSVYFQPLCIERKKKIKIKRMLFHCESITFKRTEVSCGKLVTQTHKVRGSIFGSGFEWLATVRLKALPQRVIEEELNARWAEARAVGRSGFLRPLFKPLTMIIAPPSLAARSSLIPLKTTEISRLTPFFYYLNSNVLYISLDFTIVHFLLSLML